MAEPLPEEESANVISGTATKHSGKAVPAALLPEVPGRAGQDPDPVTDNGHISLGSWGPPTSQKTASLDQRPPQLGLLGDPVHSGGTAGSAPGTPTRAPGEAVSVRGDSDSNEGDSSAEEVPPFFPTPLSVSRS
jgi:hypothetical protein